MQVTVRLFAGLREAAGRPELVLDLPDGARVRDALDRVAHLAPDCELVLAVNREYADPGTVLAAGDELAVVPPVSGGALLDGVDRYMRSYINLPVTVADEPRYATVLGLVKMFDDPQLLERVNRNELGIMQNAEIPFEA